MQSKEAKELSDILTGLIRRIDKIDVVQQRNDVMIGRHNRQLHDLMYSGKPYLPKTHEQEVMEERLKP